MFHDEYEQLSQKLVLRKTTKTKKAMKIQSTQRHLTNKKGISRSPWIANHIKVIAVQEQHKHQEVTRIQKKLKCIKVALRVIFSSNFLRENFVDSAANLLVGKRQKMDAYQSVHTIVKYFSPLVILEALQKTVLSRSFYGATVRVLRWCIFLFNDQEVKRVYRLYTARCKRCSSASSLSCMMRVAEN